MPAKRTKSTSQSDSDEDSDNDQDQNASKKFKKPSARQVPAKATEFKELVVRKRMASLNASAMLAATYEVERHLEQCESIYNNDSSGVESDVPTVTKKAKDIKGEILETKDVNRLFSIHARNIINILLIRSF